MKINLQKISNVASVSAVILLFIFWQPLLHFFDELNSSDLQIINAFLTTILSWPVAVLILGLVFFLRFSKQISTFLGSISSVKWGSFEAQGQRDKLTEDVVTQGVTLTTEQWGNIENLVNQQGVNIQQYQEALKATFERAEHFEFAYLNLALVFNSKIALQWFALQPNKSSTRQNFFLAYQLPPQVIDHIAEKEAIFSILLTSGLITQNGEFFTTSEKGEKFLKHIGLLK